MAETVFSAARLRTYRVLEAAGLGAAADLQILGTVVAARLWVPLSLIEIAFRNAADALVTAAHPRGSSWLFAADAPAEASFEATNIEGASAFTGTEGDALADDDPVRTAAITAGRLGRSTITRDDVIAHLMLGFWVVRVPDGLRAEDSPLNLFDSLAAYFDQKLGDGNVLEKLMRTDILLTRNRVAHHEPVLIRAKHVFDRKTGEPKTGNELVTSLQGAVEKFERLATTIDQTARIMAPMAGVTLDAIEAELREDLRPLREQLQAKRAQLTAIRDARRAERRASSDEPAANGSDGEPSPAD
jgi:hypothetical protein